MGNYYFSKSIDATTTLCLAPITDRLASQADAAPSDLSGYFLFERCVAGAASVKILAQVHTDEGAFELSSMLGLT
jgi:hypothetical protein